MIARRSAAVALFGLLVVACASTSRPSPTVAAPSAWATETSSLPEGEPDDEEGEEDGDADAGATGPATAAKDACPPDMVLVATGDNRFCIDRYEGSLVEVDGDGHETAYPHYRPVDGHKVRAVSQPDVFPQGFISEVQAEDACGASGKRLCTATEWKTACIGPERTTFPYGNNREAGVCHDTGRSAVAAVFGFQRLNDPVASEAVRRANAPRAAKPTVALRQHHVTAKRAAETSRTRPARATEKKPKAGSKKETRGPAPKARASVKPVGIQDSVWSQLNDPRLGQVDGALARTGSHPQCTNGYGVVDMVGNLHEWVKTDPEAPRGVFAGGYYLDTKLNGDGCNYRTTAHAHDYHDYSTGFRCCK